MRVAALYDIHGNLPALEAVLREIDVAEVDRIVVGDDVLPGPMPKEAIALLTPLPLPTTFISGNGEAAVLKSRAGHDIAGLPEQAREAIGWSAKQLAPHEVREIERWPATSQLQVDGVGDVLFCHATPRSDTEIFTKLMPDEQLAPMLEGAGAKLIVCGHTHMQFDRHVGDIRVANAGSVGMPFGDPGAYWLLLGPGVTLRRSEYDLEAAAARVRATAYPQAEEFAACNILHPPSEREILEAWRR
jgi:predicted phosphodiesterase